MSIIASSGVVGCVWSECGSTSFIPPSRDNTTRAFIYFKGGQPLFQIKRLVSNQDTKWINVFPSFFVNIKVAIEEHIFSLTMLLLTMMIIFALALRFSETSKLNNPHEMKIHEDYYSFFLYRLCK